MKDKIENIVVILASGSGSRYGGNIPKQYLQLNGREVLFYPVDAAIHSKYADKIIVVADKSYHNHIKELYDVEICAGGITRNLSVKNALEFIKEKFDCRKIVVMDGARPLIKADIIDEYFEKLDEYDCVITAQKIVDSLGSYDNIYEDREKFFLIQAPEAFRYGLLYDNFDGESSMTALCQFLPKNCKLMLNFDMKRNPKVTYKGDLEYISQIIASETADE